MKTIQEVANADFVTVIERQPTSYLLVVDVGAVSAAEIFD